MNYPNEPGHKETGGCSEIAANEIATAAPALRAMVVESLGKHGPMTTDETACKVGKTPLAIRPRFSELFAGGVIKKTSLRRRNPSGKLATVWELA
jgi:predicted ArsR family transcriptional regulator